MTPSVIKIQSITVADVDLLANMSSETFYAAFGHLNNADDMDAYAAQSFTIQQLTNELKTPGSNFYFALVSNEVTGFLKLNTGTAQNEFKDQNSLEVERLYVLAAYQGKQIGKQLLDIAFTQALKNNNDFIWLGVWEHNYNAIHLYERMGFSHCGSHDFMLGNDKQTDLLMKKELK
ncbi:GNAT family N-acetyltransferase [Mucilaginibacter galii]|uniref:N-acetyltransferase n=1 Tax=Mucilaginibacter galii TaxID=2005073 RepID=A0A917N1B5_9SPHI|nr:GNAT family N-acetyltransferase [Mucilaginibacter galii]GGI50673.1 N-acetyltransferase [Mucilaginibacter galii]